MDPEPLIPQLGESGDPAERVTLDDSVRMALLVVLERLTPAERVAFVLHDVFQFSSDAVSSIVGRSPASCRQLANRTRRQVQAETGPACFTVEPGEQHRVAERFIGQPGALALHSGRVVAVFALTVRDVLVKHVHAIANPYKLAYVMSLLQPNE